jgi:hypothetical protein
VDRSGDGATAKTELGRHRVIMDAPRNIAGVIHGSAQRADEHMVAQLDFCIHGADLEANSSRSRGAGQTPQAWSVPALIIFIFLS